LIIKNNYDLLIIPINDYFSLALEETKAILESINKTSLISRIKFDFDSGIIIVPTIDLKSALTLSERVTLVKYVGLILGYDSKTSMETLKELLEKNFGKDILLSISIDYHHSHSSTLVEQLLSFATQYFPISYVSLTHPIIQIKVHKIGGKSIFTAPLRTSRSDIIRHEPEFRPYAPSATMDAVTSRLIVNLSRCRKNSLFLDPFSGSGSILLEAARLGCKVIGLDVSPRLVYGARFNFEFFSCKYLDIFLGDATKLPLRDETVDSIGTDPPYGRSAIVYGHSLLELYEKFLEESYRVLRKHGYLCFCAPLGMKETLSPIIRRIGFEIKSQHSMRVHKSLTRLITVLFVP